MEVSGVSSGGGVPPGGNVPPIYDEMNYLLNSGEINTKEGKERFEACLNIMNEFLRGQGSSAFQNIVERLNRDFTSFFVGVSHDANQLKQDLQTLIASRPPQLNRDQTIAAWRGVFTYVSLGLQEHAFSGAAFSAMRNEINAFLQRDQGLLGKPITEEVISWVTLGGQYLQDPSKEADLIDRTNAVLQNLQHFR